MTTWNSKGLSDEQVIEALKNVENGSSLREQSRLLDCNKSNLIRRRDSLIRRGLWKPSRDAARLIPEPYAVKRRSQMLDADGNLKLEWLISEPDKEKLAEMMRAAIEALKSEIVPTHATPRPEIKFNGDLLNLYVLTDYHLGMFSWHEETGADWDMKIAEQTLNDWVDAAVASSPNAKTAVLANIGDFLHWDGMDAVTPASKHVLDADTRFQKLVRVAIRMIRNCISKLLAKYENVYVIMADANHDPASEAWLREMFAVFYEHEPRVTVDTTADTYYCYEHGLTSLFFHHGHKRKPANIDTVFAAKFREVFGRTKYSYAHMGHLHSIDVKETNLMLVEQHRTLAAPDAYASRGGWISGRDAKVITYHKDYGKVAESVISIDMLK